jgi:hypothetical protein
MNISILSTASAKLTKKKECLLVKILFIYMSIIRTQTKMKKVLLKSPGTGILSLNLFSTYQIYSFIYHYQSILSV